MQSEPRSPELYDPSKESIWTRLGLTIESFKRAPGTTGYVRIAHNIHISLRSFRSSLPYLTRIPQWSGYLGWGRGLDGPNEATGQSNVAAEDETAPLGTSGKALHPCDPLSLP
jgi:hypothetical protein